MRLSALLVALAVLPVAVLNGPPAAAEESSVEVISVSGSGGRATFAYTVGTGRWCVDTRVEVQVSTARQHVPSGAPVATPRLGVSVSQASCGSGRAVFTGQGVLENPDFTVTGGLNQARLRAGVTAVSAKDGATREVDLDVVWTSAGEAEPMVSNEHVSSPGVLVNTHHDGTVRRASAAATVSVLDPASTTGPVTAQASADEAALWETADKRITVTGSIVDTLLAPETFVGSATATTASSGYWSGYWTWNPTLWKWVWTWVWYPSTGGYLIS